MPVIGAADAVETPDQARQTLVQQFQSILDREGCSKDVYEIATKSLA